MEADASLQLCVFILTRWRLPCPHLRVIFPGFTAQELWEVGGREPGADAGSRAATEGRAGGAETETGTGTPRPAGGRARPSLRRPGSRRVLPPSDLGVLARSLVRASRWGRIPSVKINRERYIPRDMSLRNARSLETAEGGFGKRSSEVIGSLAWSGLNFLRIYEALYQVAFPVFLLDLSHTQTSLFVSSPLFSATRARCNAPTHGQGYIPAVPHVRHSCPSPVLHPCRHRCAVLSLAVGKGLYRWKKKGVNRTRTAARSLLTPGPAPGDGAPAETFFRNNNDNNNKIPG